MDEVARAAVAEEYRLKLRELFDTLDQNHNGYLSHKDIQLLGYVVTGKVPSFVSTIREIERVHIECASLVVQYLGSLSNGTEDTCDQETRSDTAARVTWPQFVIFSRHLADMPLSKFSKQIDTMIRGIIQAEPRISTNDLQRLRQLHEDRYKFFPQ